MNDHRSLLIVEDSDEDFEVTCWALRQAGFSGPIRRCSRAEEALQQLCPTRPAILGADSPGVVLLDLNLPGMNGQELLKELRGNAQPPAIPIVILSTSTNPRDIAACYRLGVAGYLCKPLSLDLYVEKLRSLLSYLFETVMLADAIR